MTHDDRPNLTDKQLEAMLAELEIESAPASLTSRLNRIPEEQGSKGWKWPWQWSFNTAPRWAMAPAMAVAAVAVLTVALMQDRGPSAAEVEQARQDLAVAFAYMDRVGVRTGTEIQSILGSELRETVKQPLSEHMPFTEQFRKEETS
jgi:hypothetical protein